MFYPVNETYFYNVNTRELIPDHLALDNISNYDLNYIIRCMYDIYDMFGRPINHRPFITKICLMEITVM